MSDPFARPFYYSIALAVLLLFLTGCAYKIRVPAYPLGTPLTVTRFVAGAGKSDITLPPGIPMGGHGPAGRVSRGYWTRLYARAIYFQDSRNQGLALVSCELFSLPAGLRAKVLQLVNHDMDQGRPLPSFYLEPDRLIISATHTHHSPSNYASSELYNSFAGPLPNFDPKLFDFLARQIARAVTDAIADARDNAGAVHELRLYEGNARGIQRNRAIAPFFMNDARVRAPIVAASQAAGVVCPDGSTSNCPRYFAVDTSLKVLEMIRGGQRRALLVFYSVHPTAMTHDSELYSSDLAGVAMQSLESPQVIAGFFNGAEGDVSPDWTFQDRDDVIRLASKLAASVHSLLQNANFRNEADPRIEIRWSRVPRDGGCAAGPRFARKPMAGAAELGGAEDGRTLFYNYGWRPEARKAAPSGEHGVKEPGLDIPLADFLDGLEGQQLANVVRRLRPTRFIAPNVFPSAVPVARARLGSLFSFATVPVEATTVLGKRIRDEVGVDAVIGLANEYIGYTTTAPEYQLQQYEGASTVLGPRQADTLVCLLQEAQPASAPMNATVAAQVFRAGPLRKNAFGPQTLLVRRPRNMLDEDLEPLLPRRLRRLESRIPRFEWTEPDTSDSAVATRRVAVYSRSMGMAAWSEADNDSGVNFLTVLADGRASTRRYAVLWLPPVSAAAGDDFSFRVHTSDGRNLCSQTFRLADLPDQAPVPAITPADCASL